MIRVDAGVFRAACGFVNRKDVRGRLHGVRIEPCPAGGIIVVATDGHALYAARDPEGCCDEAITIWTNAKIRAKIGDWIEFQDDGTIDSKTGNIGFWSKIEEQGFIDWRAVIPAIDSETVETVGTFDVDVFAPVAAAAKLTAKRYPSVRIFGRGNESSFLVTFPARPDSLAVVMPLRNTKAELPMVDSWFRDAAKDATFCRSIEDDDDALKQAKRSFSDNSEPSLDHLYKWNGSAYVGVTDGNDNEIEVTE